MAGVIETFLLAMTPIGEVRVALPVALAIYKMNWLLAYFISVIGNMLPIVFLLLFLGPVSSWLSKNFKIFNKFFTWLFERTRKKTTSQIEKYGDLALMIFVAVPLPFTGAWTGAIVAFLFGITFKRSLVFITLGVAIAGLIVLILTKMGLWLI